MKTFAVKKSTSVFYRVIWLLPAAFALHIAEEYFGNFPRWVSDVVGGSMDLSKFIASNSGFMLVLLMTTAWASVKKSKLSLIVLIAWASANLFWDFIYHVLTVPAFDRYSPGLITATFLYFPLSYVVARICLRDRLIATPAFAGATAIGALLMAIVIWGGIYKFAI